VDLFTIYEQQLERWRQQPLGEVVAKTRPVVDAILALADELKKGTIDAILRMSDLEVGLRYGKPRT
jgi:hypothetical protein